MADNTSQNEVLIGRAPSTENVGPAPRRASSGNLKVAGLTLLGCLLLAGQAVSTYVLLNQRQHLTDLQEGTNTLRRELSQRTSVSGGAGRVMQVPLNMPLLKDFSKADEKAPQGRRIPLTKLQSAIKTDVETTPAGASALDTKCNLEAGGPVHPGFYKPQCDEEGHYLPLQCWHSTGYCWCVDQTGTEVPGSRSRFTRPTCQ
ncbi:CD74 molecule, major histocompatibility complex, class II invariant chain a [Clupea harengus]|uniref:CD74 molecule, major histocompatibility complex, class II invariant chain a n=1 Tax=Clupea harengus TaxID=7950 RepID=A0A6P3VE75_CLUHA|nr:CD74 molecule, major histocompatibility complex, class II invariant chain a [Clupea harengus]